MKGKLTQLLYGIPFLLVPIVLSCSASASELSSDSPWEITADKLSRFEDPATVIAEGNVVLVQKQETGTITVTSEKNGVVSEEVRPRKPLTITGDWIRLDPVLNTVKVRGNAVLDSDDEHIIADVANLDLDNHTGTLKNTTVYFPQRHLFLAGEHVQKTGALTYHLEDGWVTKCDPEDAKAPPWSFGWTSGNITQEGFAQFINATLRVKDIPVVYSPYFAFSTNTKRKTGLLLPEFSHGGRDGFGVVVPLFLNLSPSADMTLYAGHLADRGNIAALEARYVYDTNSKGTFAINHLRDRLEETIEDDFNSDGILRTAKNRYWLRGKVDHDFGFMLGKLDLDLVSDQDFLQEYQDGRIGFDESDRRFTETFGRGFDAESTVLRTNTAQLSKVWQDMAVNGEVLLVNDPTPVRSTSHLWTLPRITFSGRQALPNQTMLSGRLGELFGPADLMWDSEYIYYWRERGLGAQRLDMHPQLKVPLELTPYLETTATVGVEKTLYNIDNNTGANTSYKHGILTRTMYDYNLSTSTILMRDFAVHIDSYDQLTHMIRPQVSYDYVPVNPQESYPVFDAVDRVAAQNLLTVELLNDFDLFSTDGAGNARTRKLAYLKLKQSYDIREARRDLTDARDTHKPLSVMTTELEIMPLPALRTHYESDLDMYGRGFTRYELRNDASFSFADIGLEYRYDKNLEVNQLNADSYIALSDKLSLEGGFFHSFDTDKTSDAYLGLLYEPECWAMEFQVATTDEDDFRFTLVFQLEGVGNVLGLSQTLYATDTLGYRFNKKKKHQ